MTPPKNKIPVKRGSVTVWIYHTPSKAHDGWTVVYYNAEGKRCRDFRADLTIAKAHAEKVAARLASVQNVAATLTDDQARQTAEANLLLAPLGIPLLNAIRDYVDNVKLLPKDTPLSFPVQYFLKRSAQGPTASKHFDAGLIEEFIKAGRGDGLSERHLESLENRLTVLSERFSGPLVDLDAIVMDDLLRKLQKQFKWTGRTRNHYRATLSNLLGYAKRRRYLPRGWNEIEDVPKANEVDGEIEVYTPEEMKKLLAVKPDKDLLPFIILGGFSGPRPSEIQRARWEDLHWESGEFFVSRGKVRTAGHRVAPFPENARALLAPIKKKKGPLTRLVDYSHPLQELLRSAEVETKHDGLRHSFVSYRQAVIKDLDQVSQETGTSVDTLTRRYCKPVQQETAKAWFEILSA